MASQIAGLEEDKRQYVEQVGHPLPVVRADHR